MLTFTEITEGNPGCMAFVEQAYMGGDLHEALEAESAFDRVTKAGIRGSRLYMLWNDCCNRDTKMAVKIMQEHSIEDILHHIDDGIRDRGRGIPYETAKL